MTTNQQHNRKVTERSLRKVLTICGSGMPTFDGLKQWPHLSHLHITTFASLRWAVYLAAKKAQHAQQATNSHTLK